MFLVFLAVSQSGKRSKFSQANVRTSGFDVVGEEVGSLFLIPARFVPRAIRNPVPVSSLTRGGKAAKFKMYEPHRVTIFYSKNSSVIRQRVTEH